MIWERPAHPDGRPAEPGEPEFPHVYGPLDLAAVSDVRRLRPRWQPSLHRIRTAAAPTDDSCVSAADRQVSRSLRFCASNSSGLSKPRSTSPAELLDLIGHVDRRRLAVSELALFVVLHLSVDLVLDLLGLANIGEALLAGLTPDSMSRSPAPMIRSKKHCPKLTLLTRSSGISIPRLAKIPSWKISRSEVITKLVVTHFSVSHDHPERRDDDRREGRDAQPRP